MKVIIETLWTIPVSYTHLIFLRLSVTVDVAELSRKGCRLRFILREEHIDRNGCGRYTSGGIYPRSYRIAYIIRRHMLRWRSSRITVYRIHKLHYSLTRRFFEHSKPLGHDEAVLIDDRHNVGDRADSDKIEVFSAYFDNAVYCAFLRMRKHMRRAYKLEGNSDSGKLFERIRAVLSARVYDRVCLGQDVYKRQSSLSVCVFTLILVTS